MKIDEIRNSFTVYVVAGDPKKLDGVTESLGLAGYMVASFSELTAAFSEIFSNPPHFILFDSQEERFPLQKAVQQVLTQLPESHIFLVTPAEQREKATGFLDHGVYELILTPLFSQSELVHALDRAAERDYFMYLNERLMQNQENGSPSSSSLSSSSPSSPSSSSSTSLATPHDSGLSEFQADYTRQVFAAQSTEECIQVFMNAVSQAMGACPAVYFKYIQNRRVLLAALAEKISPSEYQGIGMNMNELAPGFRAAQLRDPMRIQSMLEMIREVFQVQDFFLWPIEALGEIQGVVAFLAPAPAQTLSDMITHWKTLLEKALSLNEAEKRLHVATVKDFNTDLLNRQNFMAKVSEEISRARRTKLPVSMISIAIDQFGQISSSFGPEEATSMLRTAARIIEKHSRVNDIIGRIGLDEFGLLLPHTGKTGAMVKAERLRLVIESADFSKVLSRFPRLTISLGVSEYPSLVRDAEELIQSADEALFQIRKAGNKTCVNPVPEGFEPDFEVNETSS